MAEKKILSSKKKFNWILWSSIAVAVIGAVVGTVFIVLAVTKNKNDDVNRITTFDDYDQLPYSYFLKDFVYHDSTTTTTTGTTTTLEVTEPVVDVKDNYYLFIYDGTKSCTDYGCSTAFTDNVGYEKFLDEIKKVLDAAIANGVQVYVADVSQTYYKGYEGGTIPGANVFTNEFFESTSYNGTAVTMATPALIKVENQYNVKAYYSGVEANYRDIVIMVKKFETSWTWK